MKIKDLVTLSDDKDYVVISKTTFENNVYYYIVENNNNLKIKFLIENGEQLKVIKDEQLIEKLLPLFLKATSDAMTEEDLALINQYIEENNQE